MSKTQKTNDAIALPSVFACEKKLVPSDGYMYGMVWENRHNLDQNIALTIREKSVRGVISNYEKDPEKLAARAENANLQTIDYCALSEDHDTLKLHFTLKILSGLDNPAACNQPDFNKKYKELVNSYIQKFKFTEIAKRYAINIANARFLWRNRVGAEKIEVIVKALNQDFSGLSWSFDATNFSMSDFDSADPQLLSLANEIASVLSGTKEFLMLDIAAYAKVGRSQEVYPSEELVLDKDKTSKSEKSKILYEVDGVAAMHSQKIGNAIRTIDTWYPDFHDALMPIAVEAYGSVTNLSMAYRKAAKTHFFYLMEKWIKDDELSDNQQHYLMAMLVRGGVLGFGAETSDSKTSKKSKNKKQAADNEGDSA